MKCSTNYIYTFFYQQVLIIVWDSPQNSYLQIGMQLCLISTKSWKYTYYLFHLVYDFQSQPVYLDLGVGVFDVPLLLLSHYELQTLFHQTPTAHVALSHPWGRINALLSATAV